MLTKQSVMGLFEFKLSGLNLDKDHDYVVEDGQVVVRGRRVLVQLFPATGLIDIWLHNRSDPATGLHGATIGRFVELMQGYEGKLLLWDGEATFQTKDTHAVTDNLRFLGIRRKRNVLSGVMPAGFKKAKPVEKSN